MLAGELLKTADILQFETKLNKTHDLKLEQAELVLQNKLEK